MKKYALVIIPLILSLVFSMLALPAAATALDPAQILQSETLARAKEITVDNFLLTDEALLEAAKAELAYALEHNVSTYTTAEKEALEAEVLRLEAVLFSILRVNTLQEAIDSLPSPEAFNRADSYTKALLYQIEAAFAQLTPRELVLVNRGENIDALLAILAQHVVLSGGKNSWEKGSDFALSFEVSGETEDLVTVTVDDIPVPEGSYRLLDRNTTVNLMASYLEGLAVGEHKLTITFTDGSVSCIFTIVDLPVQEAENPYLWPAVGGAVLLALVVAILLQNTVLKGRKHHR